MIGGFYKKAWPLSHPIMEQMMGCDFKILIIKAVLNTQNSLIIGG
ncbi:hypothetical protein AQULUS_12980 [Aquicella lusitana]|uniref:Uncharacterized protein n=1 Tax=Aquicella lusitana TaxID=254246 RepID=A0A370GHW9_9COXI|nr:hypothetical protein C8D86_11161 [Aquicella lusitana]VVC73555.1 hypothetical protein AQULUS_12980 [Aquicella lusitana]